MCFDRSFLSMGKSSNYKKIFIELLNTSRRPLYPAKLSFLCLIFSFPPFFPINVKKPVLEKDFIELLLVFLGDLYILQNCPFHAWFLLSLLSLLLLLLCMRVCVYVWMWSRCGEEKFYSVRVETLIKPCYCLYVVYYFQFCMVPRRENYQMTQSLLPDLTSNVQFVNVWMTECDPPLDEYRGELNASIWLGFMWEST